MRHLPFPTDVKGNPFEADTVFDLCIKRVRNPNLRMRLSMIRHHVISAEIAFKAAATQQLFHTVPPTDSVGDVTKKELIKIYTSRMVGAKQPGRPVYDRIISIEGAVCPLCNSGMVSSLDHYLPKDRYTALVVNPSNLVPSCTWCQVEKDNSFPDSKHSQTLHPYFDNVDTNIWLAASVQKTSPASFLFHVREDSLIKERLDHHLKTLNLCKLFVSYSGTHLSEIRVSLGELHDSGGPQAVILHFEREIRSIQAVSLNGWRIAMYRSAIESDWFCDGGFRGT